MGREQVGVRARGKGIQIDFYFRGVRCRETLRLPPTARNIAFAKRKRESILHEIVVGTFDYSEHFPDSQNRLTFGSPPDPTVKAKLDAFLEAARRRCEYSTWRDYRSAVEHHLEPVFGSLRLSQLTVAEIKAWLGGLTISNKRINNILVPLRGMLDDAHADGLIDRNPMTRIRNLSTRLEDPDPFSPSEIKCILAAAEPQLRNLFQFAFWTGLRTSELIALEWADVDWKRKALRVRRATVRKRTKDTKTAAGQRTVKLLVPAIEALQAQREQTFLAGSRIFHNPRTGVPWETDGQIRKTAWVPTLRRAGVTYRNPYQTRHTYASMLLSAGENPLWVAQQMGHKDWGMIRRRYGRWIPELDPDAGGKVLAYWSQAGHRSTASD